MRSQRPNRRNVARQVEDLEGRVVLSALGAFGPWQTMLRAAAASRAEVQRLAPASPVKVQRVAPASPFQYAQSPARNLGPSVVTWQGVNLTYPGRVPGNIVIPVNSTPTTPSLNVVVVPQTRPLSSAVTMKTNPPTTPQNATSPTTSASAPTVSSLPPNVVGTLNVLYQDYSTFVIEHPDGTYYPPPNLGFPVVNNAVGISVSGNGQGDFATLVDSLKSAGMNVSATNSVTWTITGMLPISALPSAAANPQTRSVAPLARAITQGAIRF